MKEETRILGIDDGYFLKHKKDRVLVIGAVLRGKNLDGVLSCSVEKDGLDATGKLTALIKKSKYKSQLRAIMLNGITMAGFNVLDIHEFNKKTGIPVISIVRKKPDQKRIENALKHLPDRRKRLALIKKAGKLYNHKKIYFQLAGLSQEQAREIIDRTTVKSNIPEPVRMAHIIASGVSYGESTKRA